MKADKFLFHGCLLVVAGDAVHMWGDEGRGEYIGAAPSVEVACDVVTPLEPSPWDDRPLPRRVLDDTSGSRPRAR